MTDASASIDRRRARETGTATIARDLDWPSLEAALVEQLQERLAPPSLPPGWERCELDRSSVDEMLELARRGAVERAPVVTPTAAAERVASRLPSTFPPPAIAARHEHVIDVDDVALTWSVDGLWRAHPDASARRTLTRPQRIGLAIAAVVALLLTIAFPVPMGIACSTAAAIIYTAVLGFRLQLMARVRRHQRISVPAEVALALIPTELPAFTVMVPAYREPDVIAHLVRHLAAIDYPADRLQILLLLEGDDLETIAAASALDLRPPFEVVLVPPADPRTKPKALNYALGRATGEIVTVYDAEDRPDPLQLRRVAATFAGSPPDVVGVQAELAYFNADENVITRWFATEYRTWFHQFLPGLAAVDAPIPLGGTSNHIRRDVLEELCAWDPFNVTEDADLGIRIRRRGYRIAVLDSITEEEANTDFVNWMKQRSRWYKGYAQTWLVHMRHPRQLIRDVGIGGFVRFNLFVGGTPLLALLNPIAWAMLLIWMVLQPPYIREITPGPVYYASLFVWIVGNFAFYYLNLANAFEQGLTKVFRAALLLPVYWVMMSIAAAKALLQLVFAPNYWEKTEHGLSAQLNDTDVTIEAV